jgi:hypothetical protein
MTHLTQRIKKIVHECSYTQRRLFDLRTRCDI